MGDIDDYLLSTISASHGVKLLVRHQLDFSMFSVTSTLCLTYHHVVESKQ